MHGATARVERQASARYGVPAEAGSSGVRGAQRKRDPAGASKCRKNHLAIDLGVKVVDAGHRVLFIALDRLIATLMKVKQENRLERQLQQLSYARVLILDEISYLRMIRE